MKNIILQHWNGTKTFWVVKCENSIRKYADDIDADYELLSGFPMGDWFPNFDTKPWLVVQKLFMLNKKYDEYDNVLLLDMDSFILVSLTISLITKVLVDCIRKV